MLLTRFQALPMQLVFALNSIGIATWFPRIPDVKNALQIDLFILSICFFMLPLGTILGFLLCAQIIEKVGRRAVCTYGNALFIISFTLPALAYSALTLGAALFVSGLFIAGVEVAINTKASEIEDTTDRRIMTSCHAYWSFGAVIGALIGGAFAEAQIAFLTQQLVMTPLLAAAAIGVGIALPADRPKEPTAQAPTFALPNRAVLGLCLMPIGALMIEGGMMEWSALFLRDTVQVSPWIAAFTFSVFAFFMGLARLVGDPLAARFGTPSVLMTSALLAGLGMYAFAASESPWMAMPAAALLGLGVANIYPLAVSAVARIPGRSTERNIAALTLIAFTAFLIGPPLIGTIASISSLRTALLLLTIMGVYPIALIFFRIARP